MSPTAATAGRTVAQAGSVGAPGAPDVAELRQPGEHEFGTAGG